MLKLYGEKENRRRHRPRYCVVRFQIQNKLLQGHFKKNGVNKILFYFDGLYYTCWKRSKIYFGATLSESFYNVYHPST